MEKKINGNSLEGEAYGNLTKQPTHLLDYSRMPSANNTCYLLKIVIKLSRLFCIEDSIQMHPNLIYS